MELLLIQLGYLLACFQSGTGDAASASFDPFHAQLEATDGRCVEARILSHDGEVVHFVVLDGNRAFAVPFTDLSPECQRQLIEHCPTSFLQLREGWDKQSSEAELTNTTIRDLSKLLGMQLGSAADSQEQFDEAWLYGDYLESPTMICHGITYLMPLREARDLLDGVLELGRPQEVITPGFPEHSFEFWIFPIRPEYRGEHERDDLDTLSGYNAIGLLVDGAEQVVAVELIRTSDCDKIKWHKSSGEWNTFDFLGLKKKFHVDAQIDIKTSKGGYPATTVAQPFNTSRVILTEIWFTSSDEYPISYCRMYMPERLTWIIAYHINVNW